MGNTLTSPPCRPQTKTKSRKYKQTSKRTHSRTQASALTVLQGRAPPISKHLNITLTTVFTIAKIIENGISHTQENLHQLHLDHNGIDTERAFKKIALNTSYPALDVRPASRPPIGTPPYPHPQLQSGNPYLIQLILLLIRAEPNPERRESIGRVRRRPNPPGRKACTGCLSYPLPLTLRRGFTS